MLHKIDQYYRYIPLKKGFKGSLLPLFGGLLLVLFTFITVQSTHAAPGIRQTINFQGKLVDDQGLNVVDTTYSVVFTLYDAPSGGAQLWQETRSVPTVDGIFREELGDTVSLATVDFGDDSLYLGIKVGSDPEMTPRVRFTASPYAFQARNVAWSGLQDAIDDLSVSMGSYTSTFTYGNNTGANDLFVLQDTANNTGTGRLLSLQTATGSSLSPFHVSAGGVEALIVEASGNVGIGTTDPTQKLDIAGTVRIRGQLYDYNNQVGTPGQVLSTTANGVDWIDASTVGTDNQTLANVYSQAGNTVQLTAGFGDIRFYRGTNTEMLFLDESSGNVGIGTTNPLSLFSIGSTSQFQINSTGVVTSGTWQGSVISSTYLDPAVILATQIDTYSELNTLVSDVTLTHNGLIDTSAELAGIVGDETGTGALVFANSPTFAGNVLFPGSGIWNSTGNVGIGTTAPGYKLDVNGDIRISSGSELYSFGSATLGNRTYTEDNYVTDGQTFTASIDALDQQVSDLVGGVGGVWSRNSGSGYLYPQTITDSVSVGHSLPVARLDVAGTAWLRGGTGNTTGLFVDTNGRVGLGITNPSAQLHIGSNTTPNITIDGYAASATASPALSFRRSRGTLDSPSQTLANDRLGQIAFGGTNDLGAFTSQIAAIAGFSSENFTTTAQGSYIRFDTTGMGTTTRLERMRLTSEGYLGIGTTSPTSKLDVLGTTWLRGGTGNTTGLYVNSSGNVGIGFTNPNGALQVTGDEVRIGAGGTITSATGDGDLYVQDVLEVDSLAGSGTRAVYVDANGVLTATGGTSGIIGYFQRNGTTLTPATVTDNLSVGSTTSTSATLYVPGSTNNNAWFSLGTGNLGIGTTSPGAKLDVQGGGAIIQTFLRLDRNDDPTNNKILFGSGADTNLYRSAANTLRTNDSLIVDGNVGIGTTNPSFPLVITGDVNTGLRSMMNNLSTGNQAFTEFNIANGASVIDSLAIGTIGENANFGGSFGPDTAYISAEANITNGLSILTKASSAIRFYTNGFSDSNERLRITSTGLVGIGTTAPASLLDVAGTTWLRGGTGNTTGLYVNGSGNVGIGTTSPVSLLHVGANLNGGGSSIFGVTIDPLLRTTNTNGLNQTAVVINPTFNTTSSNVANAYGLRISPTHTGTYTTTNAYGLYVDATTISSGALTNSYAAVFNGGNVGIGTTSPGSRLEVNAGASTDALKLLSTTNTRLRIDSTGASATPGIDFQSSGSGVWSTYLNIPDSSLRFWKGADRVIFDTNGNVGIGSTITSSRLNLYSSVSNGSVSDELRIQTYRSDFSTLAGSSILFKNQDSNNAVNEARIQVVTANDTSIGLNNEGSSSFIFNMTNGGVAADRVIFRADGNVGIGTTNPGYRLDVNGDIRIATGSELYSNGSATLGNRTYTTPSYVANGQTFTASIQALDNAVEGIAAGGSGVWSRNTTSGYLYPTTIADRVGIGTTSPGGKLQVGDGTGTISIRAVDSTGTIALGAESGLMRIQTDGTNIRFLNTANGYAPIQASVGKFETNANSFFVGNLGIGTTNPQNKLDIADASGVTVRLLDIGSHSFSLATPNNVDRLSITGGGGGQTGIHLIGSSGNVGIGITNPLSPLHVVGNQLRWDSSTTSTDTGILFMAGTDYAEIRAGQVGNYSIEENLSLQAFGGNVGIGTTSPQSKLAVSNGGANGVEIAPGVNAFGLSNINYITSYDRANTAYRDLVFDLNSTPALMLKSNGTVGIGTTSTITTLDVNGDVAVRGGDIYMESLGASGIRISADTTNTNIGFLDSGAAVQTLHGSIGIDDSYANARANLTSLGGNSLAVDGKGYFSGNVGIGTTNPSSPLHVTGSARTDTNFIVSSRVNLGPGVGASDGRLLSVGNLELGTTNAYPGTGAHMMLTTGGNVGIGTTNPGAKLEVVNTTGTSLYLTGTNGNATSLIQFRESNTNAGVELFYDGANDEISFRNISDSLNLMTIERNGRVGIGTTAPGYELQVVGTGRFTTSVATNKLDVWGVASGETFMEVGDGSIGSVVYSMERAPTGGMSNEIALKAEFGPLTLWGGASGTPSRVMTLLSSGNVGIGTTGPGAKLEVVGIAESATVPGTASGYNIAIGNASNTTNYYKGGIGFNDGTAVPASILFVDEGPSGAAGIALATGNNSTIAERLRVSTTGNVGIGTTNPATILNVGGATNKSISVDSTSNRAFYGAYQDAAVLGVNRDPAVGTFYSTGKASSYISLIGAANNGYIDFLATNTNNTNPPSRMRITGDGNLGIGTTSPSAQLSVVGNAGQSNLLSIRDENNQDVLSATASKITSAVPHEFLATGNVSMAYDLIFTNQSNAAIKSNGPLEIVAGEVFENQNLTLKTYNAGKLIIESSNIWADGTNVGIGTTNPQTKLDVSGYLGFATTTFNQFVKTGGRGIALNNGNDIEWLGSTYSNGYGHRLYSIDPGFGSRTELRLATRNNSGTWTDRLSIESSGDIGIGTTDPTHMLDVNGNLGVEGRLYVGNDTNYLSYPTGSYGTIQVNGSGAGGWEGYSIDGRSVFMHDGSNTTGIYNDVDNEWMFYGVNNSYTEMRYNGLTRIQTSNAGASVTGALTATSFAGNGSSLTSLNASNLSSGTVADARITGSYTGLTNLTGSGTFTAGNAYISSNGIRVGTTDLQGFHYSNGSGNLYIGGANSQDGDLIINNSAGASRIELRAFDQTQIMKNSSGTTTLQLSGSDTIQSYINSSYGLVVGATSQSEAKTTFVGSVPSNSWTNVKIDSTTSASNAGVYSLENNFTHSTAITGSVGVAMYGQYNTVSKSGADSTTGHTQVYGIYANGTNLPTVNAGTRTAYGGYFRAQGNANGTSTTYGVYCEALGADTNRCGGNQAWTNVSDMRVKTDIELITSALDKISAINGVSFRRTDDGSTRRHIGFLAQQVLPHVPEVVLYDEAADRYSMEYSSLTALLVEGVKEQQGQILDIDMRIDDLGDTLGIQLTDTGDVLSTVLEETNIELAQQTVMIDQINIEKNVLAETVNSLTDTIQQLTTRLDKTDEVISETQTDVENIDARVTALEQFFAGTMSTDSASLFLSPSASVSAQIARSITDTEVIIDKKLISEDDLTVLGTLSATDISAVGTISSGLLTINGFDDTTATPSATITTLGGELKLQHDGMNGIDMIAGKVKVDINGNVLVYQGGVNIAQGDLTIQEGSIKGSESIRGIDVVVDQGALTYDVVFNSPNDTDSYAVSILPTWFTAVLIEEKTVDGFKVRFNSPAPANARLDWIIIE